MCNRARQRFLSSVSNTETLYMHILIYIHNPCILDHGLYSLSIYPLVTTGKLGFVVRLERTAKARKHTAKPLPCVFIEAHGKGHTTPYCTVK
jgi:hypothetical protein